MKDTFELNETNGKFIGLFLAEGSITGRSIRITNLDESIQNFVKSWYESNNINYNIENRINKCGGRSYSLRGNSSILVSFLSKFVGVGAENKFVPAEAFTASKNFIKGLLNGYFSGDGCVTKNSIDASSSSKRLIEGISMLCSRFGIFCKTYTTILKKNNFGTENIKPSHRLRISAQWAEKFSNEIDLIHQEKDNKMKSKNWISKHRKYDSMNDIVMDQIVEINVIEKDEISKNPMYSKMYDLTIPSTFNFGLSNGLQVRDTATTGYLQRRLIKALEDIHVCYDGSVRTAQNLMLQMLYGDSGINQAVQTEIKLEIVGMNNKQVEENFTFSKTEIKKIKGVKNIKELNKSLLKNMIKYRDKLRKNQIKFSMNYKILEDKFMLPINFVRIIQENLRDSNKKNKLVDPNYIIEKLEKFLSHDITQLISVSESSSMKDNLIDDENRFKLLLRIAMYEYLNPKDVYLNITLQKKILIL